VIGPVAGEARISETMVRFLYRSVLDALIKDSKGGKGLILQDISLQLSPEQWRVMRIKNWHSAFYAEQSNHCSLDTVRRGFQFRNMKAGPSRVIQSNDTQKGGRTWN
jgi:hypothetical protein